jgi:hypothetical protein
MCLDRAPQHPAPPVARRRSRILLHRHEVLRPSRRPVADELHRSVRHLHRLEVRSVLCQLARALGDVVVAEHLGEGEVVAGSDDVDRHPHQRRPDEPPLLERPRQLLAAKAFEPRPECDVGRVRPLCLQTGDPLDGPSERELVPSQQHLPLEQRAIQLAQREHAFASSVCRPDASHLRARSP